MRLQVIFMFKKALFFGDVVYYVPNGCPSAEKISLALKWAQLGPKRGQNEFLGHFLVQNSFVLADFAYYD